jgi:pectinesterase
MMVINNIYRTLLFVLLAINSLAQPVRRITVAPDGSGNYKTVQAALDAVSTNNKNQVTIFIKNGIYKEKLILSREKIL